MLDWNAGRKSPPFPTLIPLEKILKLMDAFYLVLKSDKIENSIKLFGIDDSEIYILSQFKNIIDNESQRFLIKVDKYCTIKQGDTPLKALFNYGKVYSEFEHNIKNYKLIYFKTGPGYFNPRIFRPFIHEKIRIAFSIDRKLAELKDEIFQYPEFTPYNINYKSLLGAVNQLAALKEMLFSIFNTVYPSRKNLNTYGQSIKNLLVLACIEVENQLKGIYQANEMTSKTHYNTKDYIKLKSILKLDKYEVVFPFYPELKGFSPFKSWSAKNPTKSLRWYDSYNAIKHNSEQNFSKATLENAISAISAVAVLIKSQYGNNIPSWKEQIGGFLEVNDYITWKTNEKILPPLKDRAWVEQRLML